jgi:hypothetical protein
VQFMLSVTRKLTLLHSFISIRVLGNASLSITDMKFTLLRDVFTVIMTGLRRCRGSNCSL